MLNLTLILLLLSSIYGLSPHSKKLKVRETGHTPLILFGLGFLYFNANGFHFLQDSVHLTEAMAVYPHSLYITIVITAMANGFPFYIIYLYAHLLMGPKMGKDLVTLWLGHVLIIMVLLVVQTYLNQMWVPFNHSEKWQYV